MAGQLSIVVGIIDEASGSVAGANTAVGLVDIVNNQNDHFVLINDLGQVVATVTGMHPALRPMNISANAFAGTTTFVRLTGNWAGQWQESSSQLVGQALALTGNIAGTVATMAFFAVGGGAVATWAGAVGAAAGAAYLLNYATSNSSLWNGIGDLYQNIWGPAPLQDYPYSFISPDGGLVDLSTIEQEYGGQVMTFIVRPGAETEYGSTHYSNIYGGHDPFSAGDGCDPNSDEYDFAKDNYNPE